MVKRPQSERVFTRQSMAKNAILVTGCSGRIGKAAVLELVSHGHNVVGIDLNMPPAEVRAKMAKFVQVKCCYIT